MSATHEKDSRVLRWGRAKVVEIFGADLRSLAAFRIVLALLVLADLTNRSTDLYAFYTDKGVLSRADLTQEVLNRWSFSLNLMNGEFFFQVLLFGIAALAALALLVGYRTRLMSVVVWVLMLSIQWRNPLVLNEGDTLLRMLLFWGMLLPLGAYWSVDRSLNAAHSRVSMRFLSIATVGLFLQIAFMYWFTAILKSGPEWRVDGTALYYAMSYEQVVTPIGAYLSQFPELLKVLTFATIGLEAFGPFLLFCPIFTGPVRTAAVLAFMSLHLGIWMTMDIGTFPWVSAFCMVCFLPGWFWSKAAKLRAGVLERPMITRRLQYTMVRRIHTYWSPLKARSLTAAGAVQPPIPGIVVRRDQSGSHAAFGTAPLTAETSQQDEGQPDTEARATEGKVAHAIKRWRDKSTWLSVFRPAAEQETRRDETAGSEATMLRSRLAINLLATFFLLYIFFWNLSTVSSFTMPPSTVPLGSFLGIKQSWDMFAPNPTKNDGWYVIPGTLQGGQQIDLLPAVTHSDFRQAQGISWEKPQYVAGTFENKFWRKYLNNIRKEKNTDQRLHFGRYICREWNASHTGAGQLETFQLVFMKEKTLPDYQVSQPESQALWEHSCS